MTVLLTPLLSHVLHSTTMYTFLQMDILHRTLHGLQPSYESTYQEVRKANFERLRGLVQTP